MSKQRITMADIAETTQVSKMTVSRVLNNKPGVSEETRQRIFDAIDELGYEVQPVKLGQVEPPKIALLVPGFSTLYLGELLNGIVNAAEHLNCELILYTQTLFNQAIDSNNTLSSLKAGMIDGMVMVVPQNYEIIVAHLNEHNLPYVIIDHRSTTKDEASVTATNRKGMLEATRYLLALGHTRIGFITGRMDIACSHERLQGYREGLAEVGIAVDDNLIAEGDFLKSSGVDRANILLDCDNPPTAIIASNDMMAVGVMETVRVRGLTVGHDVSVIGFDDVFLARQTHPQLTTVRQPLMEMGEVALDMLVSLLQKRPIFALQRDLPTELIVRETTGRPPA